MAWRLVGAALATGAAILACATAQAQTLYAANVRTMAGGDAQGIAGSLYTVNLGTGSGTFVAPIRLNGVSPIGVTGLASHSTYDRFFGVTSQLSPTIPNALVSIDPVSGNATLVGEMRHAASDLAFNRAGILFAWLPQTSQLGIVNTTTGAVTPIGAARAAGPPGGISIDANGRAYIAAQGGNGTLDTVDIATGAVTPGPQLQGAPFPSAINSMTFTPSGLLLAVNSNAGSPANTRLVAINVASGAVAEIGTLPDDTDALTFSSTPQGNSQLSAVNVQTLALMVLGVIALILGLIGWFVGRRPR